MREIEREDLQPKNRWRKKERRAGATLRNDNGERLLTKIEVVVMTGIARDGALREGGICERSETL